MSLDFYDDVSGEAQALGLSGNRATNQVEQWTIHLFAACTTTRVILTWVQEEPLHPQVEFPDED